MEITPPVIHLNGTNGEDLMREYDAAAETLRDFIDAWGAITCNGRDYYPKGSEYMDAALKHRAEMAQKIRDLQQYIDSHREAIYDQLRK